MGQIGWGIDHGIAASPERKILDALLAMASKGKMYDQQRGILSPN